MRRKGKSKRKPLQEKTRSFWIDDAIVCSTSIRPADNLSPVEFHEAENRNAYGPHQSPFEAILVDASLMQEFFTNDSLGG